ncbi:hypothetical protein B0H19DRAFT_1105818 [Mycena capillaripes]|nr:hypothetical protein B0H19DRAFT_1105818 [Mycena capillaripes]
MAAMRVVELKAIVVCKNGLNFDNWYAWALKFHKRRKIVRVYGLRVGQAVNEKRLNKVYEFATMTSAVDCYFC